MKISPAGLMAIQQYEGLELEAYLDSVNVPTIGYGSTQYVDGRKVRLGDKITQNQAEEIFAYWVANFSTKVDRLVKSRVNQQQFDALVSLAYNIGIGAFEASTVLKRVKANPADQTIRDAFMAWNKGRVKGKLVEIAGLTNRRRNEAKMYFS